MSEHIPPWVEEKNLALFTDLYELTMMQAYFEEGMTEEAVFSLFVRRLPARRNFFLACGVEDALRYLENLRFNDDDIAYLGCSITSCTSGATSGIGAIGPGTRIMAGAAGFQGQSTNGSSPSCRICVSCLKRCGTV